MWIVHNFPDHDDQGANSGIWRFGTLELHFGGDVLDMIFCDHLHDLRVGPGIALDRWILDDPGACSLSRMMREFTHLGIDIAVRSRPELQQTEITVLDSDVRLGFHLPQRLAPLRLLATPADEPAHIRIPRLLQR